MFLYSHAVTKFVGTVPRKRHHFHVPVGKAFYIFDFSCQNRPAFNGKDHPCTAVVCDFPHIVLTFAQNNICPGDLLSEKVCTAVKKLFGTLSPVLIGNPHSKTLYIRFDIFGFTKRNVKIIFKNRTIFSKSSIKRIAV